MSDMRDQLAEALGWTNISHSYRGSIVWQSATDTLWKHPVPAIPSLEFPGWAMAKLRELGRWWIKSPRFWESGTANCHPSQLESVSNSGDDHADLAALLLAVLKAKVTP